MPIWTVYGQKIKEQVLFDEPRGIHETKDQSKRVSAKEFQMSRLGLESS